MIPIGNVRAWQETDNWTRFHSMRTVHAAHPLVHRAVTPDPRRQLPKNDGFTLSLLTNDEVIAVNQNSTDNKQILDRKNHIVWTADVPDSKDKYLAIFNVSPISVGGGRGRPGTAESEIPPSPVDPTTTQPVGISVSLADMGLSGPCKIRDLWVHKDLGTVQEEISAMVNSHGAVLYRVQPEK